MKIFSFFSLILLFQFVLSKSSSEIEFFNQTITRPNAISSADLNGDGYNDILISSLFDKKLIWFENNQDGSFLEKQPISDSIQIDYISIGDLDSDGDEDILYAFSSSGEVGWFENNGIGNFSLKPSIENQVEKISIKPFDIDSDGDIDLLISSVFIHEIIIYINNGEGVFMKNKSVPIPGGAVTSIEVADLNGDGLLDLVSGSWLDHVFAWYENDGTNNYLPQKIISRKFDNVSPNLIDWDKDGDIDVISTSNKIYIYINDGAGTFSEEIKLNEFKFIPYSILITDLDNNEHLDLLSKSDFSSEIYWFENIESKALKPKLVGKVTKGSWKTFPSDIDKDNDIDIIYASFSFNEIYWYENDNKGNFKKNNLNIIK